MRKQFSPILHTGCKMVIIQVESLLFMFRIIIFKGVKLAVLPLIIYRTGCKMVIIKNKGCRVTKGFEQN